MPGKRLTFTNGEVVDADDPFAGMRLRCTNCFPPDRTRAHRKPDDPKTVCRCSRCGKKHSTESLRVA